VIDQDVTEDAPSADASGLLAAEQQHRTVLRSKHLTTTPPAAAGVAELLDGRALDAA
jgi:hypothetical protein